MNFERKFHPVGQGAFYTERHLLAGKQYTIVYDCGSQNRRIKPKFCEKRLKKRIEATFYKKQEIDVLFISHFHYDHINGIEFLKKHCDIKRVVMPYVDDKAKVLLKIINRIAGDASILPLIDDPKSFFGGIPVVTIKDFLPGASETDAINRRHENLSGINNSCEKDSGVKFTLSSEIEDWYYIPYNFKDSSRREAFERALQSSSLKLSDITAANIEKHIETLRKAYKQVREDLNETSMVLFSGKAVKDAIICSGHCPSKEIENSGCLYTGDVNLKQPDNIKDLKSELNTFYKCIGTLQVPHHGSFCNFDNSILDDSNIKCAVVSYGYHNCYGHPSNDVIDAIKSKGVDVHCVTECSSIIQK